MDEGGIIYDDSPNYEDGPAIADDASKERQCRILPWKEAVLLGSTTFYAHVKSLG